MATRQRFSNSDDDKAELKPLLSSSFAEPKHEPPHAADTVKFPGKLLVLRWS